jgi:hypothetical protein
MSIISNYEDWLEEYRKDKSKLWIIVSISSGEEFYFTDYNYWFAIKSKGLNVTKIKLQYRSNVVEKSFFDCDGVYLIRSVLGRPSEDTIQTMTIGTVIDGIVHKDVFVVPSLVLRDNYKDSLEECFEEAIIWSK